MAGVYPRISDALIDSTLTIPSDWTQDMRDFYGMLTTKTNIPQFVAGKDARPMYLSDGQMVPISPGSGGAEYAHYLEIAPVSEPDLREYLISRGFTIVSPTNEIGTIDGKSVNIIAVGEMSEYGGSVTYQDRTHTFILLQVPVQSYEIDDIVEVCRSAAEIYGRTLRERRRIRHRIETAPGT